MSAQHAAVPASKRFRARKVTGCHITECLAHMFEHQGEWVLAHIQRMLHERIVTLKELGLAVTRGTYR